MKLLPNKTYHFIQFKSAGADFAGLVEAGEYAKGDGEHFAGGLNVQCAVQYLMLGRQQLGQLSAFLLPTAQETGWFSVSAVTVVGTIKDDTLTCDKDNDVFMKHCEAWESYTMGYNTKHVIKPGQP